MTYEDGHLKDPCAKDDNKLYGDDSSMTNLSHPWSGLRREGRRSQSPKIHDGCKLDGCKLDGSEGLADGYSNGWNEDR